MSFKTPRGDSHRIFYALDLNKLEKNFTVTEDCFTCLSLLVWLRIIAATLSSGWMQWPRYDWSYKQLWAVMWVSRIELLSHLSCPIWTFFFVFLKHLLLSQDILDIFLSIPGHYCHIYKLYNTLPNDGCHFAAPLLFRISLYLFSWFADNQMFLGDTVLHSWRPSRMRLWLSRESTQIIVAMWS